MAAIDQPVGHALIVREAAAACRLSPRTIRRKLHAGAFPNAFKSLVADDPARTVWKIPVSDLEQAGLEPTLRHPAFSQAELAGEPEGSSPTVLELVRSDRFGRLRAELAEAVAAAELALLRAEAERWRVIAEERAQALDRADLALKAVTSALQSEGGQPGTPPGPRGDIVAVPPLVRAEAMRYTATLQALHDMRKQDGRWWHFWR
ncbi:MAG: hypothetical protein QOG50_2283 [Actinomycetota bacterium]|jgi:hypothetical protein|nr:hypothetical protein [Actinomycetota bacterium]